MTIIREQPYARAKGRDVRYFHMSCWRRQGVKDWPTPVAFPSEPPGPNTVCAVCKGRLINPPKETP
jgi:hypothetical protein